ncbi:MAG: response regulator [Candidatus Schekmanbacteria bacterium]|nr:response regulator [Candidatus Schekmanbacteria bacterium]
MSAGHATEAAPGELEGLRDEVGRLRDVVRQYELRDAAAGVPAPAAPRPPGGASSPADERCGCAECAALFDALTAMPAEIVCLDQYGHVVYRHPESASGDEEGARSLPWEDRAALEEILLSGEARLLDYVVERSGRKWAYHVLPMAHGREQNGALVFAYDMTELWSFLSRGLQQEKHDSLLTFASGLAHEFNNLLVCVLGPGELLQVRLQDRDRERKLSEHIIRAATRMSELTNQLLSYARGNGAKRRPARLDEVLAVAFARLSGDAGISAVGAPVVDLPAGLDAILIDPAQAASVFAEILRNSVEAGAALDAISISAALVEVSDTGLAAYPDLELAAGSYVHVQVRDAGHGMTDSVRKRIFEPFFSTKFLGRGLGLAAAQGIMRANEGWIEARSEPRAGATVHLWFPACPRPPASAPASAFARASHGRRILVVDDDAEVRGVLGQLLDDLGYECVLAADGQEAVAIVRTSPLPFDLVVLDLHMPGLGGDKAFSELVGMDPNLRIAVYTGYDEALAVSRLPRCGEQAVAILRKPLGVSELRLALDRLFEAGPAGHHR